MKELQITLYGRVQGVNFRRRVLTIAKYLGLKGFVSKTTDGGVNIIAQGKENCLDELLNWCQKSHFPTKISGMKFFWNDDIKQKYRNFKIKSSNKFFKDELESIVNLSKEIITTDVLKLNTSVVPEHVVIIPDGNRRWAKEHGWLPWIGHKKAMEFDRLMDLFTQCKDMGINYLSFWGFSTENWSRDKREVDEIFNLIRKSYKRWYEVFKIENIRFRHLGRKDRLPKDIFKIISDFEDLTRENTTLNFQLCLDYNGRDDIVRAVNKILSSKVSEINEETFKDYLDTHSIPDPDLIIRTSGEIRTSGVMAYESAYSELYFTNVYFPDFDAVQFKRAILEYSARNRNFGGTNKKIHKKDIQLIDPDVAPNQNIL